MAEEKKSKAKARYGESPKMKGGKMDKKAGAEGEGGAPEAASKEAAKTAGKPEMTSTGEKDGELHAGGMDTGTEGDHIQVHSRHEKERMELMARHDKERHQMHGRHESDHKSMASRHTEELAGMRTEGSSAKTAGDEKDKGAKNNDEPKV